MSTGASGIEQFFHSARMALLGPPPEAAMVADAAATIRWPSRRRRVRLQQGGLFALGVSLGILFVLFTDFDRTLLRTYAPREVAAETPNSRRLARTPHKDAPRGTSQRAIPTL